MKNGKYISAVFSIGDHFQVHLSAPTAQMYYAVKITFLYQTCQKYTCVSPKAILPKGKT